MANGIVLGNRMSLSCVIEFRLALMEMRLTLSKLIWQYDMKLREGQGDPGFFHRSLSAGPLEIHLTRVDRGGRKVDT